jgi:hypothetical protein
MIVRTHRNGVTVHIIGYAVIEDVTDDINVVTSERMMNSSLCLTAAESRAGGVDEEGAVTVMVTPFLKVKVHLACEILASLHTNYTEFSV